MLCESQTKISIEISKARQDALQLIRRGALKFRMNHRTIHLSMLYFDLVNQRSKTNWFTNAFNCLILACKFGEKDDNVPLIEDMIKGIYS